MAPTYANQQLRSVSLETYFRGRLSYRDAAGRVQRRVEKELPHLFVPNSRPDAASDLQAYQLRSDNGEKTVALAVNQVTYVSRSYPGHEQFCRDALSFIPAALGDYGVEQLERVVYRYENEVAITRDEREVIPVNKVLKLSNLPWWRADDLTDVNCTWTQHTPHGRLGIRVAVEGDGTAEKMLISIISMIIPGGPVGTLAHLARQAHDSARAWFEGAITDDFRAYIKGDSDE